MKFSDKDTFEPKEDYILQYRISNGVNSVYNKNDIPLNVKVNRENDVKVYNGNANDDEADINTKEKERVKDIENYQSYQEATQDDLPWASERDVRIVDSDNLPNPNPIMDTEGCPECGNIQAYWWIVQTDSGDEPSTQFFRCTKCNHTWRTAKSSL